MHLRLLVGLLCWGYPLLATAKPAAPPPADHIKAAEGMVLFRTRDFARAAAKFHEAWELRPYWRYRWNEARALEEAGATRAAYEAFTQLLRQADEEPAAAREIPADHRREILLRRTALQYQLMGGLAVHCPAATPLQLQGPALPQPRTASCPWAAELLELGRYTVTISTSPPSEATVEVQAGQWTTLELPPPPAPPTPAAQTPPMPAAPTGPSAAPIAAESQLALSTPSTGSGRPILLLVAGGLLAAAGGGLLWYGSNQWATANDRYREYEATHTSAAYAQVEDAVTRHRLGMFGGYALTGVAVGLLCWSAVQAWTAGPGPADELRSAAEQQWRPTAAGVGSPMNF